MAAIVRRLHMKRFIHSLLFALTIPLGVAGIAQSPSTAEGNKVVSVGFVSDTVDVQHVIDAYHEAVLGHDGERLTHLFLPEGGMWLNVLSDDTYARAKTKSPDALKIRIGNYTDFVKLVSTSKASFNPTHTHLQQNSDGTVASVYFDFVFLADGKEQNRGSETWVLVKGTDGWRIAAITFSSNPHAS
jgi:hypothetical protein